MTYGDPSGTYRGDPQQPAGGEPASGLGKRLLARLIDFVLIGIVFALIRAIAGLGALAGGFDFSLGSTWAVGIVQALVTLAYFAYLESSAGQSLGKMALSLRTRSAEGGSPTLQQAAIRNSWVLLPIIPYVGGILEFAAVVVIMVTIGTSGSNRGLHDQYANTAVVDG